MSGWKLVDNHPTHGRTFQRPLDKLELSFFWESLFNGTADFAQHYEIRLLTGSQDTHLFSTTNITRAWLSTKRRYPLVGATVHGHIASLGLSEATNSKGEGDSDADSRFTSDPHFVVREHDLSVLHPREIVFGWVSDKEEAQRRAAAILEGPRPLSEELLVQLYVFHEKERIDAIHLVTMVAHCVADGTTNYTIMRCLLDTLARSGCSDLDPAQIPLEDRLAMVIPLTELEPIHVRSLSPARRRWRRAIGLVIFQLMMARRQGGQTLPCRITRSTPYITARSGQISTSLTRIQSAVVLSNCRMHGITFGNAYLVLAQVAMTRVLYRRYLRGEIPEGEWRYRKCQPHITCGPFNLRPYLDKLWFDRGGGGELMLSIGFFAYELPFMTLDATAEKHPHCKRDRERVLLDGAPSFSDLLCFGRFSHRARLVRKQAAAFFSHPLFFEIALAANQTRVEPARLCALRWLKRGENGDDNDIHGNSKPGSDAVLSVMDMPTVLAHGGSSMGDLDSVFPSEYPLPPTHPLSPNSRAPHPMKAGYITPPSPLSSSSPSTSEAAMAPKISVEHTELHLHTRPSQLYLGAARWRERLKMFILYDGNVYEDDIVKEWLDEVKGAVLWYLGRTHDRSDRGDEQIGFGESLRAKL